mmetsp:Transcript_1935/g.2791  ORF Transcript_1935/g.2791 Transcript_1935/m.2791 type:complete len:165 (+) Transcript_1935:1287-1781(+)
MSTLEKNNQEFKLTIIRQLYYVICVGILAAFLLSFFDFYLMVSESRDQKWSTQWLREQSWFWIFTIGMIAFVAILKPNENTKKLANLHEVNDDAKTENPDDDLEDHGIELSKLPDGQDFNPSGRRSSMDDSHGIGVPSLTEESDVKDMTAEEFAMYKRQQRSLK